MIRKGAGGAKGKGIEPDGWVWILKGLPSWILTTKINRCFSELGQLLGKMSQNIWQCSASCRLRHWVASMT